MALKIRDALVRHNGNRIDAARALHINRVTLYRIIRADEALIEQEMAQNERVATASTKAQPHVAGRVNVQPVSKAKAWLLMFIKHAEAAQ